jgi:hypothetical protein
MFKHLIYPLAITLSYGVESTQPHQQFDNFFNAILTSAKNKNWTSVNDIKEQMTQYIKDHLTDLQSENIKKIIALSLSSGTHIKTYQRLLSPTQFDHVKTIYNIIDNFVRCTLCKKNEVGRIFNEEDKEEWDFIKTYGEEKEITYPINSYETILPLLTKDFMESYEKITEEFKKLDYFINLPLEDFQGDRLLLAGGTFYGKNSLKDQHEREQAAPYWYSVEKNRNTFPNMVADVMNFKETGPYSYLSQKKFNIILLECADLPTTTIPHFMNLLNDGGVYYTNLYGHYISEALEKYAPELHGKFSSTEDMRYIHTSSTEDTRQKINDAIIKYLKSFGFKEVYIDHIPSKFSQYKFRSGANVHWIKTQQFTPQQLKDIILGDQAKPEDINNTYRRIVAVFCIK